MVGSSSISTLRLMKVSTSEILMCDVSHRFFFNGREPKLPRLALSNSRLSSGTKGTNENPTYSFIYEA
jgi:hypothetical protein